VGGGAENRDFGFFGIRVTIRVEAGPTNKKKCKKRRKEENRN